jgi:hypothetical protein
VLQWVFLGAAVVAAGAGVYVLVGESGKSDNNTARVRQPAPRLTLAPWFDRRSLAVEATLRF